jgi:pre-mRNA-processing factor SLU7
METSSTLQSSYESKKKQKEDAKKRQAGELAPDIDVKNGKIINPHNPEFITKVPWYIGNSGGPTLTHHSIQKQDHFLSLSETEQILEQKYQQRQLLSQAAKKPQSYKKGACKNCGSSNHSEKECIERPRSVKNSAWKTGIANTSSLRDDQVKLEDHGKISYDAKRDYWKGYDPKQYNEVIEHFDMVEEERRRVKQEEIEKQRALKEKADKEKVWRSS